DGARVRDVVSNGDTAGLVHRRASHPTKIVARRERPLLEENRIRRAKSLPGGIAQFIPTNSYARAAGDRMVDHHRFMRAEIAIAQSIHQSISQTIELLTSARLWDANAATACS